MTCPTCGSEVQGGARFCPSCGHPLDADLTVAASADETRAQSGTESRRTHQLSTTRPPSGGWLSSSDSISHGRFEPGSLLDGRYRIIGLLGRGGMGEVYRADDLRLGQPVALKLLPADLRSDPVRLAQFHNEVRTARQVSHPNVCRVYDIGESGGLLYLSMEYVDGEDLATSLRRIGRFPEDKAADIARQLCAGLSAAHQRGVTHRDLKPANVMLDGAGHVRVMDFGLAAIGEVEDIRAGTPAYMAPEQLLGRRVTARSDIFALGLVMYELFTGRRAFTAATIGDLVNQHQTRALTPPSDIVTGIEPATERAILSCLDPDPARRPASALAVAAALPGGNPLAAVLAAGETPSPEMVAAAGEGVGLSRRTAWAILVAVVAGLAAIFAMAVAKSPLDRMRPQLTSEVLAQKTRDVITALGYVGRPRDEAYGFHWDVDLISHVRETDAPEPRWNTVFVQRPSPLRFWYRRSPAPLTAWSFRTDLLVPGIVDRADPPTTTSGMVNVELDHAGRLSYFEALPEQHQPSPPPRAVVDWPTVLRLAELDPAKLQTAEPQWHWLAASDTRVAWTGTWPESGRPLRVEAAALGGRPVAFMLTGPWQKPWRTTESDDSSWIALILLALAIGILVGSALLARGNLRAGRGDRRGADRVASAMTGVLLVLWVCQVHFAASLGLIAMFLLAICTSVFYGVLLWMMYIALEPYVRRHWPQVLVSWTNVLTGNVRDPVVGRDVLVGVVLAVAWVLLLRLADLLTGGDGMADFPGSPELLVNFRTAAGGVLQQVPYAVRNAFLFFFLLFGLRVLLRGQWRAALAFASLFAVLNILENEDHALVNASLTFIYFGTGAVALLRHGLLTYVVGLFLSAVLMIVPATRDASAWFFGNMLFPFLTAGGLALWGALTSSSRTLLPVSRVQLTGAGTGTPSADS